MFIMCIDQGTTSSRAILLNHDGRLVASASREFRQIFPQPGWVEHNPDEIWDSVQGAIQDVLEKAKVKASQIHSIGITNQRETVVLWSASTGKPVHNALVWQDRRTTAECEKIKKSPDAKWIFKKTGLIVDPYFSATKLKYLLKNVSQKKDLLAGTIDTFLIWKLTGGKTHATDVSNASRTMLMDLKTLHWDDDLLKFFKIPKSILPEIKSSSAHFGQTAELSCLPSGISITGVAGDQQAALFGQTCFESGEAKCTFGTGSFILFNTGTKIVYSKSKMLTTVAWQLEGSKPFYALEGGAFICGAAVQWLRDGLKIISNSSEMECLANSVNDNGGVTFIPALTGLGAPHWRPEARGMLTGLTRGTSRGHIARATLQAMALQNVEILKAMESDLKQSLKILKVDGGATANNLLMQMQSDYSGVEVQRPKNLETTALGAGYLAGLGSGFWKDQKQIKHLFEKDQEFKPQIKSSQRKIILDHWRLQVTRV